MIPYYLGREKRFIFEGKLRREWAYYGSRGGAEARRKEEEKRDSRRGAEIAEEEI
jgi:hypothetical protein